MNLELVAIDAGLVELLDRQLDALLVLRAEIGARARHGEQCADLDRLILRVRGRHQKTDRCRAYKESPQRLHIVLPAQIFVGPEPINQWPMP